MGFAKIKGELTSRIGSSVRFNTPKDVRERGGTPVCGKVVDEVWVTPEINRTHPRPPTGKEDWGDYSFCAQLIKWNDGTHSIRLAYYRRRAGEDFWEFASQTTVVSDWRTIKTLCEKTLGKANWFLNKPIIR